MFQNSLLFLNFLIPTLKIVNMRFSTYSKVIKFCSSNNGNRTCLFFFLEVATEPVINMVNCALFSFIHVFQEPFHY